MVREKKKSHGTPKSKQQENSNETNEKNNGESEYEQFRDQRIKENLQRIEKLGILDLSRNLKKPTKNNNTGQKKKATPLPPSSDPPRRSYRLKVLTPVSYFEKRSPKKEGQLLRNLDVHIKEGSHPEIYTEEHEKLLGDCKTTWTLLVDGYDEDGQRIYDPLEGKSCHQCRQKTLGHRTYCSRCKLVQGQFCGDCLYMRYGENVIEVNNSASWICPVCRGICNCSRCRREKGWEPTGSIYRKVIGLGFKSVAHYLIQTRGMQTSREELATEDPLTTNKPSLLDIEVESSDGIPKLKSDGNEYKMEKENTENDGSDGSWNGAEDDGNYDDDDNEDGGVVGDDKNEETDSDDSC